MLKNNKEFNKLINEVIHNFLNLKSFNNFNDIKKASEMMIDALKRKNKILFCGNGGSAADSQHLTAELIGQFLKKKRKAIAAISLTTNTSTITSVANDTHYDLIFSRQIEGIGRKGDILFCISTSGKSKNIIKAMQKAKQLKLNVILLTGKKEIRNKNIDLQINAPSLRVDRIQEMHIFIGHLICETIEKNFQ
jgi:D-sedoheptulose 7-phosphate isomerase